MTLTLVVVVVVVWPLFYFNGYGSCAMLATFLYFRDILIPCGNDLDLLRILSHRRKR